MAFSTGPGARRLAAIVALAAVVVTVGVSVAHAQFGFGRGRRVVQVATPDSFDGRFQFCRAFFRSGFGGDGGNWSTDFPNADINFSIRLSELTRTDVSTDQFGYPNHLVVQLTQDELYQCPFIMMLEVGSATFDPIEAAALRDYLLKGGFLWVDDFWGSYAWDWWENQVRNVFPDVVEHPIIDLPSDHPLFSSQFEMDGVPQIPSINFFLQTGGTSERGMDSAEPHARAVLNEAGHIMLLMTHNTDITDSWEREGDDPRYFYNFGPRGYAFGINVALYALTH